MPVNLETIHFNHDTTSNATGAFSIRKNETINVVLPEWRRDQSFRPEDAPAAYAFEWVKRLMQRSRVSIRAEFSCDDATITEVRIKADDGHANLVNVLGTIAETPVKFVKGRANATLFLDGVRIPELGVSVGGVIWKWKYQINGGAWTDLATTCHRIYTVVDMPRPPWQPGLRDINNTQLPWTEVLDIACARAVSTTNVTAAATKITLWANSLGPTFVHYDEPGNGWTGYTYDGPARFHCTDFLLLLNSGTSPTGPAVNCDDCAAIVTSFSNVLGSVLSEGKMQGDENFLLKPNKKIGLQPFGNGRFSYHTVAWLGNATRRDPLFDACVQLDPDGSGPQPFTVPVNILFNDYQPQLARDPIRPVGKQPVRRIGLQVQHLSPDSFVSWAVLLAAALKEKFEFMDVRFIETTLAKFFFQSFWKSLNQADVAFGIDTYQVAQGKSTAPLLENILSRFHLRPTRMSDAHFGGEAYASEGQFTIVFARDQFVFLLRNTGKEVASPAGLAKSIVELMSR